MLVRTNYKITHVQNNTCKHISQMPFKNGYRAADWNDAYIFNVSFLWNITWLKYGSDPMAIFNFPNWTFNQMNVEYDKFLDVVFSI